MNKRYKLYDIRGTLNFQHLCRRSRVDQANMLRCLSGERPLQYRQKLRIRLGLARLIVDLTGALKELDDSTPTGATPSRVGGLLRRLHRPENEGNPKGQ